MFGCAGREYLMLLLSLSCRDNEVMGFRVLIFCSLWWWGHNAHHYFAPIKQALNVKSTAWLSHVRGSGSYSSKQARVAVFKKM